MRESKKLLAYESEMAAAFDATVFVSEKEADFFKELVPQVAEKVVFRVQGVDSKFFDPALPYESPYPVETPIYVFAGAMDYWPNIHAAIWFAEEIFPKIKQQVANACFYIVGMNPSDEVLKLAEIPNVFVTGSVDDIRPYIACATISVAPLRIARGIQNKVLEAMAMAKPILATKNALNGIDIPEEFSPVVAETVDEMVDGALTLLNSSDKEKGVKARQYVLEHYNWDTNLRRIDDLLKNGL
jgi:sugar transferase (PEP-CTERM/EpsH1 system associated)